MPLGAGIQCLGYVTLVRADAVTGWTEAEDEAALVVGREIGRAVERARLYQRERLLVAELQELDRYKGEMIATITHELKNPLTSIGGHVELLQDERVAPRERRGDRPQRRPAADPGRGHAAADEGQRPPAAVPADARRPSALIEEARDLLTIQAERTGLTIDTTAVRRDVAVRGERDDLARLLVNVVGNAVKYTPPGGRIVLALDRDAWRAATSATRSSLHRHRHRHLSRGPRHALRRVRPLLQPGRAHGPGHRHRAVDRAAHRRPAWRLDRRRVDAGVGSTFRVRLPHRDDQR